MRWLTTRFEIDLGQPRVMGIVNLTPDSFSDGGRLSTEHLALRHAEQLLREGADLLDLGAESSRPGAPPVSADEEWTRLEPLLREALRWGVPVSLDTCKPAVMARGLDLGVDIINDIQAMQAPGALDLLSAHPRVGVCLMHMRGQPGTMQQHTQYSNVVQDVRDFLGQRLQALQAAGVGRERVTLDPGLGFAKTPEQNLALSRHLRELVALGQPVLVGWSRKSTLGWVTGRPVQERLAASVAAALLAAQAGARVLRVHDVAATVDALRLHRAVMAPAGQSVPT
ncbi:dihydropteroate synthase [Inhella inkyongensis]|uniref:Dihydropteroate synthase n=1 Tax=Inhella inkyongensis TaxID=392593 RepID=A0A840S3M8_9BURK|nr:dihydropteroate synthase [Inhella inkyongensis]MBB5204152.1 dihydropteroate synthase [Inhella inkyongensis]